MPARRAGVSPVRRQMEILYRLNGREIKNATPREKDYRLSDGGGLYLVVKASGGDSGGGPTNSMAKES